MAADASIVGMGKGHKNHKPQRGSASPSQPAPVSTIPLASSPAGPPASTVRRIGLQLATLLGLSAALGFTFNAANPIGVRFGDPTVASARATTLTNFTLTSTASVAAAALQSAPELTPPPTPEPIQRPIPRIPIPRVPTAAVTHVDSPAITPITPASAPPTTNSAPLTVAPAQTNLNPAPIHWREAKPLATAGQAVLVDVRAKPIYDAAHIPDAVSLPETSSSAEIAAFLKLLPTNMTVIVYCSSTSCSQSLRVANRLVTEFRYAPVKYMTGGYLEYQQEELARSQQPANPPQPVDR